MRKGIPARGPERRVEAGPVKACQAARTSPAHFPVLHSESVPEGPRRGFVVPPSGGWQPHCRLKAELRTATEALAEQTLNRIAWGHRATWKQRMTSTRCVGKVKTAIKR